MSDKKPIILVDGSSYFFRAYHALPPLINSKGLPTGAIYGVANMVKKLLTSYEPQYIGIIFDTPGKTTRHELYPLYKANRTSMPDDLRAQFEPLKRLLLSMGLSVYAQDGIEADDILGTLATHANDKNLPVLISTSDKDLAQLVNTNISLINTMSNQTLDIIGVQNKFGVLPEQIIDYLSLIGDSSDNIPGVPMCGPKTAVKWLQNYKTLDNIIEHAHEITGKVGENLQNSIEILKLSKTLVTIDVNLDLNIGLQDLKLKEPDLDNLKDLLSTLEFKTWLKEYSQTKETINIEHKSISQDEFNVWQNTITQDKCFAFKSYTVNDLQENQIFNGIAIATNEENAVFFNCPLELIKPFLESREIIKICHDFKKEYSFFKKNNIEINGDIYDVMLESYISKSDNRKHDLDTLLLQNFSIELPIEPTLLIKYILKLHNKLYFNMPEKVREVFNTIEMPLVKVLVDIEDIGVSVDLAQLEAQGKRLEIKIKELEEKAYAEAGIEFNLNSPKQLQEILYDKLCLPVMLKTPKGQPSTAEAALQELAMHNYLLPEIILEHRSLSKLLSTYIYALPKYINPKTNRIHTHYNQTVTSTGRLSSSDPNLQNIPVRNAEGQLIRKAFIARDGHYLISADYSQIELRIMAHLSSDSGLLSAFEKNLDIHTATASEIFNIDVSQVTPLQRRHAKAVNFGLIYGMSAFGLEKQLHISREEAQVYIDKYFERYPRVLEFMESTRLFAKEHAYVETLLGRRLYTPDINNRNAMLRKMAERAAINAPLQGSAAELIKKAMINIWQYAQEHKSNWHMIMQVHDELIFEVPTQELSTAVSIIKTYMENAILLSIPLEVDVSYGFNWDELTNIISKHQILSS